MAGMNAMGYDALTLGNGEFSLGLATLKEVRESADFSFLSANVVEKGIQDPIFDPYIVLERQGITVGIIGLSEIDVNHIDPGMQDQMQILDPIKTAKRYVGELRDRVDVLIVLSHLGLDEDEVLAQDVAGIDIIVGGKTQQLMREPKQVSNTLILQQGYRGEWMGRLQVAFDAQGDLVDGEVEVITLDNSYAYDADMMKLIEKWEALYPTPTARPSNTPALSTEISSNH